MCQMDRLLRKQHWLEIKGHTRFKLYTGTAFSKLIDEEYYLYALGTILWWWQRIKDDVDQYNILKSER